jgi:26S proteasome regulatory subunit T2
MGNAQGGPGGGPPGGKKDQKNDGERKKWKSKGGPSRVGRKKRKKGPAPIARLPKIFPSNKCKLRLSKLTRVKDFLLLEEEFMRNQEILKPKEEKDKKELEAVEELRGTPLAIGSLEEMIDDSHCIVSISNGIEYYVSITSFVDKDQLEPGCTVLLHNKVSSFFFGFLLGFHYFSCLRKRIFFFFFKLS